MTIDTQSFQLKSVSEPLDNATIVLHLSLFVKDFHQQQRKQNTYFSFVEDFIT